MGSSQTLAARVLRNSVTLGACGYLRYECNVASRYCGTVGIASGAYHSCHLVDGNDKYCGTANFRRLSLVPSSGQKSQVLRDSMTSGVYHSCHLADGNHK